MENDSLHQKVWPSEVTDADYEFLCLFLNHAKKEDSGGAVALWRGEVSLETTHPQILLS